MDLKSGQGETCSISGAGTLARFIEECFESCVICTVTKLQSIVSPSVPFVGSYPALYFSRFINGVVSSLCDRSNSNSFCSYQSGASARYIRESCVGPL